jgi:hypothetical protein
MYSASHFSGVIGVALALSLVLSMASVSLSSTRVPAQKKARAKAKPSSTPKVNELDRLRDEYVSATKDYKASLERLLAIYEEHAKTEENKVTQAKRLFDEGLIARLQVEDAERAHAAAKGKVAETRRQMEQADTQIANVLVEAKAEEQLAKNLRMAKGSLWQTTSFIRYNGAGAWALSDAWKVQRFFSDKFKRPLPIAVFGQGAIHDRWRLDHRNSMDVSLYPDTAEGQALMNFLRNNGIPFLAFRQAIPGTATGPHIHVGRPSHRY